MERLVEVSNCIVLATRCTEKYSDEKALAELSDLAIKFLLAVRWNWKLLITHYVMVSKNSIDARSFPEV